MATQEEEEQYRQLPRGVPTLTYARLLDPSPVVDSGAPGVGINQDDLEVDGDFVTVKEPGQALARYPVAHVFPKGMTDQEFCEFTIGQDAGADLGASLNPIAACVEDATSAVIMLVGSKTTKKWQFLKRIFLPFVANELFACLQDKKNQGAEVFHYEITLKCFEIQDEVITDLLRPTTRGLSISVAPESGVVIQGLQRDRVTTEQMLRQMFIDSCDNRSSHTLPLGASIDTSSTVWELSLHQKEGDHDVVLQNLSRLLIVDTPATNPLCMTASDVKVLDGPNLHKSLFTFADVSRKLASPQLSALAPYRSSKLTHFLGELLGGNCLVLGLAFIHPGEPAVSKKTLEIVANLTAARHYPISGKEMSEIVQGLMMKYRSMLLHMEDELHATLYQHKKLISNNNESENKQRDETPEKKLTPEEEKKKLHEEIVNSDHSKRLEAQVVELQGALVEARLLCEEKSTDAAQIYEVLELLKAKYTTLLSELSAQNEKMISIEREKLEVARALVELKMELSREMEAAEKEKFELTSTVLALKTQGAENDDEIQVIKLELRDTNDKLAESQKWFDKEREKAVACNSQLEEVRGQLEKLEARNIEISTELVNLLNIRDTLQRDLTVAQKQVSDMEQVMDADGTDLVSLRNKNAELEKSLVENEHQRDALSGEITQLKIEMERMTLEVERSKLDFEKNAAQYLKDKDKAAQREGNVAKSEIQQLRHEKDQLVVTLRREERQRRDAQRTAERLNNERHDVDRKLEDARAESDALREAYRKHLAEVLQGVEKDITQRDGKKPTFAGVAHGVKSATDLNAHNSGDELRSRPGTRPGTRPDTSASEYNPASWEAMIDSFIDNERKLYANNEKLCKKNDHLVGSLREMFGQYRNALDIIEDNCPQNMPKEVLSSEDVLLQPRVSRTSTKQDDDGDKSNGNGGSRPTTGGQKLSSDAGLQSFTNLTSQDMADVVGRLEERLKEAEDALLAEQVKSADTCNSYRKALQRTEKKLLEANQENGFLKERIDIISSSTSNSNDGQALEEVHRLRDQAREEAFKRERAEYERNHDAQLADLYKKLELQMIELKAAKSSSQSSSNKAVEGELRNQLSIAKQQLLTLKNENTQMRAALLQHGSGNNGGVQSSLHDESQRIVDLENYVQRLESNAEQGILYQLREVEKRNSALISRNAGLEQELTSYKVYMRDTLAQNKRHTKALKDQVIQQQLGGGASKSQSPHHRHRKHRQQDHQPQSNEAVERDVDTNQGLLERYVQLQQQQSFQESNQFPHQQPLMGEAKLASVNSGGSAQRRKQSASSGSVRSQSAGSHLPSTNNDVFFPSI